MIFFFLWPFEVHISVKVTSNCGIGVWKNNIIGDITFESSSISNYAKAVVVILQNVIKYVFVLIKKFHRNNKAVTVWKQHLNRVRTIISNQCLFKKFLAQDSEIGNLTKALYKYFSFYKL